MGKDHVDIIGKTFGNLTPIRYIGNSTWLCRCTCGNEEEINYTKLINHIRTDCKECANKRKIENTLIDLSGQTIKGLTAVKYMGNQIYLCRCNTCNRLYEVSSSAFKNGIEMCRECRDNIQRKPKVDYTNTEVGSIKVDKYIGSGLWECTCKCGNHIKVKSFNIKKAIEHNRNYMCSRCKADEKRKDLTGMTINKWRVLEYTGDGFYKCECLGCGNTYIVSGKSIRNESSKSCKKCGAQGAILTRLDKYGTTALNVKNSRTETQINAILNSNNLKNFILDNFDYKPKAIELARLLGIGECITLRKVHKFGLDNYISIGVDSQEENELYNYIKSIYNETIIRHDRNVLCNTGELDILIPDKSIAFEFNGTYWHSALYKDNRYHQNKTKRCFCNNIHLVHIFEYEWLNNETKRKLLNYIDLLLDYNIKQVGARKTTIKQINIDEAKKFVNEYHLQGWANSFINYGCYYNDELVGVMTFGVPRFSTEAEYEIIRSCWKDHIRVIGGVEKFIRTFIKEIKPSSILTYADISKFNGLGYMRSGFISKGITEPGYVWVNTRENKVLTRYKTQKHKLLEDGIGEDNMTEVEIMESAGYLQVYNCGNAKLIWNA